MKNRSFPKDISIDQEEDNDNNNNNSRATTTAPDSGRPPKSGPSPRSQKNVLQMQDSSFNDEEDNTNATYGSVTPRLAAYGTTRRKTLGNVPTTIQQNSLHNDPTLKEVIESTNLQGSTRIMHNYKSQVECSPAAHRPMIDLSYRGGRGGSGSFGDLLEDETPLMNPFTSTSTGSFGSSTGHGDGEDFFINDATATTNKESISQSFRQLMMGGGAKSVGHIVKHIQHGFFADARSLTEGTIPQSVVLALVIGIVCGIASYLYYSVLMYLLEVLWHTIPEKYVVGVWPEYLHVLWIPIVSFTSCLCVGLCVIILGEPGDLPFTISCIHNQAYIPMNHVIPMAVASLFSIFAGGSLGPEAPLVAICGALGGFISRQVFGQRHRNVIRKHTLMGMAGALSAFFGTPLGGSLFALEVNSRFGIEYYEHMVEAIFAGEVCLVVFRSLSKLPMEPIWNIHTHANLIINVETGEALTPNIAMMTHADPSTVVIGACIGLLGAGIAYLFATFHWFQMGIYNKLNLLDNKNAIYRAMIGGVSIIIVGMFIPQTMFWDEFEYEKLVTMAPASELPHVWPTSGLIHFEMDTPTKALIVGFAKLITISCSVAAGLRGGYIFPLFAAGGIFGRVLYAIFPSIPLPVAILSFSAAVNVAITRTSLATTLILAFLAGEPCAIPAVLAASLCSLFATAYLPFIKTQITRSDIDHSLYHQERVVYDVN